MGFWNLKVLKLRLSGMGHEAFVAGYCVRGFLVALNLQP